MTCVICGSTSLSAGFPTVTMEIEDSNHFEGLKRSEVCLTCLKREVPREVLPEDA
jgi:hypothetical protein